MAIYTVVNSTFTPPRCRPVNIIFIFCGSRNATDLIEISKLAAVTFGSLLNGIS
jgi:hypothetical protein